MHERNAYEAIDLGPGGIVEILSGEAPELDTGFGDVAPVAAGLLALSRREGLEEIVEIAVALVVPVKLAVLADF